MDSGVGKREKKGGAVNSMVVVVTWEDVLITGASKDGVMELKRCRLL